jgi:hypothetical protein
MAPSAAKGLQDLGLVSQGFELAAFGFIERFVKLVHFPDCPLNFPVILCGTVRALKQIAATHQQNRPDSWQIELAQHLGKGSGVVAIFGRLFGAHEVRMVAEMRA